MRNMKLSKWLGVLLVGMSVLTVGCSSNGAAANETGYVTEIKEENPPIATIEIEGVGTIEAELYPSIAPNTVNNFIHLANSGFYDGLTIHRIEKDFVIQGGDPNGDGTGGPGYNIPGEFQSNDFKANNLAHVQGVLSMARSNHPDSAGSQFFIMIDEASHLDGSYAAFGKVTSGLDVVTTLNSRATLKGAKPAQPVVIKSITVDTKGITYPELEKTDK